MNMSLKGSPKEYSCEIISKLDQAPPPPPQPFFLTDRNFTNNFRKGSPKEQSHEIISKSDKRFQRRRILKNFSEVHTVKKALPHGSNVFQQIKISQTIFEKGHTSNNLVKLFKILTSIFGEDFLRIFSCLYSAKSIHPTPSPPWRPCFSTDQNFANNFLKSHPWNIPVKFFSNQTRGFREEDFFKNFFISV